MNESLLSGAVTELDTVVLVHDPETGAVLAANAAAEELYGYSVEELTQLSVEEFSSESDRYSQERAEQAIAAAADGVDQELEWQIETACGDLRWVRVRLHGASIDGEEYVLAEIDDITEAKTRSRRLRLLYRVIRHNLRNEMTVIMGHADSLRGEVTHEQYQERLDTIQETAESVGKLTDSVQEIEQLTSRNPSDDDPTDVRKLISRIGDDIESRYPDATVEIHATGPGIVAADGSLEAALYNAIENAVEHSREADPVAEVRVESTAVDGPVTVQVVDQGPKIPQMELDALETHNDGTGTDHGTGLGLFVMKWCTESLGGDIDIRTAETGGNLVEFTLPMCEDGPKATGQASV